MLELFFLEVLEFFFLEVLDLFFSERLGAAVEKTGERPPEKCNTHP